MKELWARGFWPPLGTHALKHVARRRTVPKLGPGLIWLGGTLPEGSWDEGWRERGGSLPALPERDPSSGPSSVGRRRRDA